jgi:hypothetical protein
MAQRDDQFAVRCSAKNACAVLSNEECDATLSGRSSVVVESERNSLVQDFVSMLPFHVGLCIGPSGPV